MKKLLLIAATTIISAQAFADVTASAVATWDASATKDTKSALVVTPLKSLNFKYAEGLKSFNTVTGAFDVTVQGQSGATDFKLDSKLVSHKLTRTTDASTLDVGVAWNGTKLSQGTPVVLVDSKGVTGSLNNILNGYSGADRVSDQGSFIFTVDSATSDGAAKAQFADLTDGIWDGQVAVQFTATWTK